MSEEWSDIRDLFAASRRGYGGFDDGLIDSILERNGEEAMKVRARTIAAIMTPIVALEENADGDFLMFDGQVMDRKTFEPYSDTPRPILIADLRRLAEQGVTE